jgi:hypothetical protein
MLNRKIGMSFIQEVLFYGNLIIQHAIDAVNGCENNFYHAYWVFGLGITNNEENKGMTNKFFEENPKLKNIPPIQSVIEFICEDNFKDETYKLSTNFGYWDLLAKQKKEMIEYYTHNVCESNKGGQFHEFHTKFYQMSLQLKRLRLVIQPEFHVIKNVHPVSKIPYLSVRGFWLDDNDKKVKIFTKSMGREDSYVDGKNDSEMLKEASNQIQQLAFIKYQEEYN